MLQACSHDKPDQKVKLHALTSLTCSWWEGSYAYLRWVRTTIAYGIPCFGAINIQHHPTIFLWTQGTDRSGSRSALTDDNFGISFKYPITATHSAKSARCKRFYQDLNRKPWFLYVVSDPIGWKKWGEKWFPDHFPTNSRFRRLWGLLQIWTK